MPDDEFSLDEFAGAGEGDIPREQRWGKPKLPHPETGVVQVWRRPSTIAKPLEDRYLLEQWEKRMVAKGIAHREDLRALAYAADLTAPESRGLLNDVARDAMNWAGAKSRANQGTARHLLFDAYDRDGSVPGADNPEARADVLAYAEACREYGLVFNPDLSERMGITPAVNAAGSWDRIGVTGLDTWPLPRICDAKTGTDPTEYHGLAYAAQQAVYSRAVAMVPRRWDATRGADQYEPMPQVDQHRATLIWVELNSAAVEFIDVDLDAGWEAALLAVEIDKWRRRKNLVVPVFRWPPAPAAEAAASGPAALPPPEPMRERTPGEDAARVAEVDAMLAEANLLPAKKAPTKRAPRRKPPTNEEIEATRVKILAERREAAERFAADREAGLISTRPTFAETIHDALNPAAAMTDPPDIDDTVATLVAPVPEPDGLARTAAEIRAWLPADGSAPTAPFRTAAELAVEAERDDMEDMSATGTVGRLGYCVHGEPACSPCRGLPITEWTLREKVANAATREVLSALWAGNRAEWSDELTDLGKIRLAELERERERAGVTP